MNKKSHWQQVLSQTKAELLSLLNKLSPKQWQTPVFSEGQTWTVLDVMAHLVDSERGMSIHIHKIRKGQETIPADFDLERWNASLKTRVGPVTPQELLSQMEQVRARTLEGLASLQDNEWDLEGRHPSRGIISIEQYYKTIAAHYATHTADIKQAIEQA